MSWLRALLAALLPLLILIGNSSVPVQNSTVALTSPQLAALKAGSAEVTYVSLSAGSSRIAVYRVSGLVLILISNVSLKLVNVSPTYVQPLGGWTADVALCVNSSGNVSLAGLWQGDSYVNAGEVPGLEGLVSESRAGCGRLVEFEGGLPEFQPLTYFTNSTWLSVLLRGDGWYTDIVLGGLVNSSTAAGSRPQGLPPPIYIVGPGGNGRPLGRDLLEGPYILLIISLLALTTSLVVEREHR